MLVIEFLAGPSAGKTTNATTLFSMLKRDGLPNVDFVREYAQQWIHTGCAHKLSSQITVVAHEYERLRCMKEQGCKVLITDASLLLTKVYGAKEVYQEALSGVIDAIRTEFTFKTVYIKRVKPFVEYGRIHNETQSLEIDQQIINICGPFDAEVTGDDEGIKELYELSKGWISEYESCNCTFE